MTIENVIVIVIGLVAVIFGVFIVRNRVKAFQVIADVNRAMGGVVGRVAAKRSSPYWIGFVGVGSVFIGVVAILVGIFARE